MTYHDRVVATPRREWVRAAIYAIVVVWLNAYICRELFYMPAAHMNSMQGFWIALAERAGGSWFHPTWWPYWDNGIPFEFTYAPLVPALTAIVAAIRGVSHLLAFQTVSGIVYCLVPLTLFVGAWRLTRAAGYSFAAAVMYSLTSPTQILVPDDTFRWGSFWDSRRLFLLGNWDETPHLLALACLPLTILFLARAIETGRRRYFAAAALSIAMATYASAFGPTIAVMAAICLLFVLRTKEYPSNIFVIVSIGALAYAAAASFLPPSLIMAIHASSVNPWRYESGWTAGSLTALAIVILGWTLLWRYLPRWTADWRIQFFALFTYLAGSIPIIAAYLHRQFVPQPVRYKFEMELGLAVLMVFSLRTWLERIPTAVKRAIVFLLIALAIEQVVHYRADAKKFLSPADVTGTIEYRASVWASRTLPGVRVMFPGSIALWADAFNDVPQFSGSSWSMAYNPVQQRGFEVFYSGETAERDARISLAWLQVYGVGAVGVSAPNSEEYWKGFAHPLKFEGLLPMLWREGGVTIYRVPQRSASLAHVIPEDTVVRATPAKAGDIAALEKYDAALIDESLPPADLQWEGRNRIWIHTSLKPGQLVSVQVSYHPGWRAYVNGRRTAINRDGLGLMWMRPECDGNCAIQLDYSGGFELGLCRLISALAILLLAAMLVWPRRREGFG
jgi:hypothetical protein